MKTYCLIITMGLLLVFAMHAQTSGKPQDTWEGPWWRETKSGWGHPEPRKEVDVEVIPQQRTPPKAKFVFHGIYNSLACSRRCTQSAADSFCRYRGYSRAESWEIDKRIDPATIETERVCNEDCDGFAYIVCAHH